MEKIKGKKANVLILDDVCELKELNIEDDDLKKLKDKVVRSEKRLMAMSGVHPARKNRTGTLHYHMELFSDFEKEVLVRLINGIRRDAEKVHLGSLPFVSKELAMEAVNLEVSRRFWDINWDQLPPTTGRIKK